jgi:hypothetical protein
MSRNEQLEHHLEVVERAARYLREKYEASGYELPFGEDVAPLRASALAVYSLCVAPRPRKPRTT